MPPRPGPILLVCHAFGPTSIAGTEMHTYHLARHLGVSRRVEVLHAMQDPSRPHGALDRGSWGGVATWRLVQNHPYRPLSQEVDPVARRAFEAVVDALRPRLVHFHHLAHLSLDLPQVARARGLKVAFTLHDYHLLCPSGGQLAAHPEGGVCQRLDPGRCAACHAGWAQRQGALEEAALRLSRLGGGILPAGWPFRVYQRLPPRVKEAARALNERARRPRETDGGEAARRLDAARAALGSCDVVLSPSADVLRRFEALSVPLPQGRKLANGAPDPWAPPGEELPPAPPSPPAAGPVRLLHIGTLAPHKGIDLMVDAAAGLDPAQAHLSIYGSPETFPAYAGPLRRRAERLPALTFAGPCAPEAVPGLMAASHALVLAPRWPENAPLTVLDARLAGRPVIAPAIGGLPELVEDGEDGILYEPGSAPALAAALKAFVASPGLRARLTAGVRRPDTAAAHARRVAAVYDALLEAG